MSLSIQLGIKIPADFFAKIDKLALKLTQKGKKNLNSQNNLGKQNEEQFGDLDFSL